MNPLVSIIIPTYNRADLIVETLESVLAQTYKNWECIVVDDGSKENTEKAIAEFLLDTRIKFYKRPTDRKKGASSCRNYGLELVKGELIQFLDDDDLLGSEKLVEQLKLYSGGSEVLTCKWGGFENPLDLKSRFKFEYQSYHDFTRGVNLLNTFGLYNEFFPIHVYLTPRELINKTGLWNEQLTNNDDAEFFTRVIIQASKIVFVQDAKVYYRYFSPENLSALNSPDKIISVIQSWNIIDETLKSNHYPTKYVKRAKHNLYKSLKEISPSNLKEYKVFFKDRKNYDSTLMNVYKRIKLI